jgi:hypothetical protein
MGIVMAVFMALAIAMAWPWSPALAAWRSRHTRLVRAAAGGIMLAGNWNALWHGLRHPDQFWGQAALVSGLLMVVAATLLLVRGLAHGNLSPGPQGQGGYRAGAGVGLLVLALLGCFLLYAITLVRLNLGLSIPGA